MNVFVCASHWVRRGLIIVLLQYPIGELAFSFVQSGPESIQHVQTYSASWFGERLLFCMYALSRLVYRHANANSMVVAI